jgi:hypothetical protein
MASNEACEGCSASVWLSEEEIEALYGKTVQGKNISPVSADEYNRRLNVCFTCDGLCYATTCRFCGSIVQIKNKLANEKCPFPYAPKW